jgi:hypothetical protein
MGLSTTVPMIHELKPFRIWIPISNMPPGGYEPPPGGYEPPPGGYVNIFKRK